MYPNDHFTYDYLAGPLETEDQLNKSIIVGNCRLAIQLYFYRIHKLFIGRDQIYLPGGYAHLGEFIFEEAPINFEVLEAGDIIYAQNKRNKKGELLTRNPENYPTKDEWIYHFHSAIYVGKINGVMSIWHATSIEDGPTLWSLNQFEEFYKPISVKRVRL